MNVVDFNKYFARFKKLQKFQRILDIPALFTVNVAQFCGIFRFCVCNFVLGLLFLEVKLLSLKS